MSYKKFVRSVVKAETEEEVISAYHKLLPDGCTRPFKTDGHREDNLFEFKYDEDLTGRALWKVVAQGCYYLREFYQKGSWRKRLYTMPLRFSVCDINEAAVFETHSLRPYFTEEAYDWSRPASNPCLELINDLANDASLDTAIFRVQDESECNLFLQALTNGTSAIQVPVTANNFRPVFAAWRERFGEGLKPQETVELFLTDLQLGAVYNQATGELWFMEAKNSQERS